MGVRSMPNNDAINERKSKENSRAAHKKLQRNFNIGIGICFDGGHELLTTQAMAMAIAAATANY